MLRIRNWIYNLMIEILEDEFTKAVVLRENGQVVFQTKMKDIPALNTQVMFLVLKGRKHIETYFLIENVVVSQNGVVVWCDGIVLK